MRGATVRWVLDADLRTRGSSLVLRRGDSLPALQALVEQTGAEAVYWNRKYEPATQPRDATIKRTLREQGIDAQSCNGSLLFEPWDIATQQGQPYKVFTRTGATYSVIGACRR
jgi:deoxyribodipyrimidine photo-lyase